MALVLKDRVLESSTSTGTGSFTLTGAQTGYQGFDVIGNGNTTYYTIQGKDVNGNLTGEWEVGVGTWSTGNTLSRDTVLESSNANAKVVFSAGNKDVFCDLPAEKVAPTDTLGTMAYQNANSVSVTGGTIDNASVGATTPSTGAFTYLSTSSSTSTTPTLSFNASNSGFASGATVPSSYLQTVLQNKSGTASASTNYVLSNDLGTDSTYYGEFGMNSSVYSASPTDFFSLNNGIYFSGHDGDLTFGSGNGYKTYFAWGTLGDKAHVINASGAIGLNTNITGTTNFGTSGQVLTSAGSAATPTWTTPTTGTVTSVSGTSPIASSGGATPAISISQATTSTNGYLSSTDWTTFNNKIGIAPRVNTTASSSSITIDTSTTDQYTVTALAVGTTFNAPTGSPSNGQKLTIRIKDNGTAQTIAWNAIFRVIGTTLFTTTVANKTFYVGCIYNSTDTTWDVISVAQQV